MLSSCNFESEDSEQLCLLSCNFCSILLAVSVPRSSLCEMVTIRCGYCTNMWSINIGASTLQSIGQEFQFPSSTLPELRIDSSSSSKHKKRAIRPPDTEVIKERVVNQPPKKRHRAPSAYNQFIKEEIQRIKANNMKITHREAFSTAAKNWAKYHVLELMMETNQTRLDKVRFCCFCRQTVGDFKAFRYFCLISQPSL